MNPIQRGQDMAEQVAEQAQNADQVILAKYHAEDYPNVLAAGFATVLFEDYCQRLAGAVAMFEQLGIQIVTVLVTAAELESALQRHELPNTPDGRAAAIGLIHGERNTLSRP